MGNPLERMSRVWLAMKGLKKTQGATTRKIPVTVPQLRRIKQKLDFEINGSRFLLIR